MIGKNWYESKTIWVSSLQILIATLTYWAGLEVVAAYPEIAAGLLAISGILGIVLRFVTKQPIVPRE